MVKDLSSQVNALFVMGEEKGGPMSLRQLLNIAPHQKLVMTHALSQALLVLQMPQIELAQWLREEVEKNPLLEELPKQKISSHAPLFEIAKVPSLYESLSLQIGELFLDQKRRQIAHQFVQLLDERGFLTHPPETLYPFYSQPLVEEVLSALQTLDPPGIFARNLQHSLLIQLRKMGKKSSPCYALIEHNFDHLLQGRWKLIEKTLSPGQVKEALRHLHFLSLRPASSFERGPTQLITADLTIEKRGLDWAVQVSEEELPVLQMNPRYQKVVPDSEEEKKSLQSWMAAAKWLFRSLSRRKKILLEIGALIVKSQGPYLEANGPLTPIPLKEVSQITGLHESTLSRALSGKYALTPQGLLPIRSLLMQPPLELEGVKAVLEKLVAEEDRKNPLTDEALAKALQEKGHKVARRTVVKYRKILHIASAKMRKILQK